uniref:Expansin n=1 Tax=Aegilops tauschii TaxID=37682 RepID=M8BWM5_AEGTA
MAAGMRFLQLFTVVLPFCFTPANSNWIPATATFYGGADGSDTMGGACGYENLYVAGYGINNVALSTALFNDATTAGGGAPPHHFDMAQPAWENIGIYRAGIIPVFYQQVKCWRQGGVRFTINGFNYFELVLVANIGGSGSIKSMSVKGTNTAWIPMSRNWGANWHCLSGLVGQALSFAITSTGGQYLVFQDVVPAWWQFGQTFTTWRQFDY